ncbi:nucleolar protein 8-like isoform X2 [Hibiscus syriacus]|uniref:nucleolar protein 8-like isoform X2 n=1 Tax=Hibiscus syriacus TaxID=106335 RepID=UPI0019216F29|nr:nucleolar protein 8-like isoform X2 [Hibiscus syriacus]
MLAAPAATTRTRIHVGGLGQSVSSDDLRKIFSAVGTVEGMDIVRTKSRSFAYVDILPSSSHSISKHFSMYKGCAWKGGKLKLEKAKEHFLARLKREWEETQSEAEAE